IFFISSRRRHTRSYGDWSSDVCSSDLPTGDRGGAAAPAILLSMVTPQGVGSGARLDRATRRLEGGRGGKDSGTARPAASRSNRRSEERRVGKGGGGGVLR